MQLYHKSGHQTYLDAAIIEFQDCPPRSQWRLISVVATVSAVVVMMMAMAMTTVMAFRLVDNHCRWRAGGAHWVTAHWVTTNTKVVVVSGVAV